MNVDQMFYDHHRLLYRIAVAYHHHTGIDVEELKSETHVAFMKAVKQYETHRSKFTTYLTHVTKNHLASLARKHARRSNWVEFVPLPTTDSTEISTPVPPSSFEYMEQLRACLSPLAWRIAQMVMCGDAVVEYGKRLQSREKIEDVLEADGVKQSKCVQAFHEIRDALSEVAA